MPALAMAGTWATLLMDVERGTLCLRRFFGVRELG